MNWDRFSEEEREILERLDHHARLLAGRFGLPLAHLTRESGRVKRRYGSCDVNGVIRLRLHDRRNGAFLKYSSLIATLCHELAHLKHLNHGIRFRALYMQILEYARAAGIYRPRAVISPGKDDPGREAREATPGGSPPAAARR
ncbi:MAG: DUF45 domain-containing protein [Deltaproteobacteria bacterium]|nr:DUF45 domain-containing protein [Deltaproteobacteria bacterium]